MRTLLFLFFTLSVTTVQAQKFYGWIDKADSLYDAKMYKASAEAYGKALALEDGNAYHYYNAACSYALSGSLETAVNMLQNSAEKGYRNKEWMLNDSDLDPLHDQAEWQTILSAVQANLDEYEKDFDKELKGRLEAIYVRDQALRRLIDPAREEFGEDSKELQYFWQLMAEEDRKNEKEMLAIIDERGWPGLSLVGGKANSAVWLVIQHAPLETQEKYLPLLKESVTAGESDGGDLALLEDRILMRNGKKQIYGSQVTKNMETGKWELHPIEDPANVNERRAKVGLGPLEDYVKRWGIVWSVKSEE